ncbi:MAG TPA: hypothetical protein VFA67_17495 [Candidatus Sulfotelmatobacter sp.]|nr:hypothetical protein [Candidatus Sulfotelmatobacter sp.]
MFALGKPLCAQGPLPDAPMVSPAAAVSILAPQPGFEIPHKFWDKPNRILFVAAAASNAADFAVTRANLQNGGRELNPMVRPFGRSTAGLALNFAGETVGVIGLSYFFHQTGHHKLERAVSMVNIGSSATAVAYGLAHR